MIPELFVAGLHLRWDGVWQRPHHLLTRLAHQLPVIVVEEPYGAAVDRDEIRRERDLVVVRPLRRRGWGEPLVDAQALATVRDLAASRRCGAWLYTPMMTELIEATAAAPVVYDVMDDLANFDFAPRAMREREAALLERADVVFAGGRTLYENRRSHGAKVRCFPSGVELTRFAADVAPHPLTALAGPVLAYVGVIDERLDYELIAALADAFPRRTRRPGGSGRESRSGAAAAARERALHRAVGVRRAAVAVSGRRRRAHAVCDQPRDSVDLADQDAGVLCRAAPGGFNAGRRRRGRVRRYCLHRRPARKRSYAAVREALHAPPERIERGFAAAAAHTWDAVFAAMWDALRA